MTKTLTEQWKDGELEKGFYYIKTRWLGCDKKWHYNKEQDIDYLDSDGDWCSVATDSVVEIIGDVPTYADYKRLQEQLKEANEIIANFRTYDFTRNDEIAEEYQVKYCIAGEKIYINKKPPKEFERWRKKITKSFEKKLKSGGVK